MTSNNDNKRCKYHLTIPAEEKLGDVSGGQKQKAQSTITSAFIVTWLTCLFSEAVPAKEDSGNVLMR
jgi:hypothetical protein